MSMKITQRVTIYLSMIVFSTVFGAVVLTTKKPQGLSEKDKAYIAAKQELLFKNNRKQKPAKTYPGMLWITGTNDTLGDIPAGTPFTLTVKINSASDYNDLTLKWVLPPKVQIINGLLSQPVTITAGQTVTAAITLSIPDNKNYQVHAEISRHEGGAKLGAITQFNSNPSQLTPAPGAHGGGHGQGTGNHPAAQKLVL